MNDTPKDPEERPAKRGDAAWKEHTDRIAQRNEQARKVGRKEREASEEHRDGIRRAAELRRHAHLRGRSSGR